jgi:hypothetical protein
MAQPFKRQAPEAAFKATMKEAEMPYGCLSDVSRLYVQMSAKAVAVIAQQAPDSRYRSELVIG